MTVVIKVDAAGKPAGELADAELHFDSQRDHVGERRRVEYPAPLTDGGCRVLLEPALQVLPRPVQELRVRLELGRDGLVQGQAAFVHPLVAAHATGIVASLAFLAEPMFAPGGGLAQGAGILTQT